MIIRHDDIVVPKRGEIRSLTGVRGIAALAVLFYHMANDKLADNAIIIMLRRGYLCVDLFFVLSGFVIALTYGGRFAGRGLGSETIKFLGHRLARVYPLYLLLTLLMAIFLLGSGRTSCSLLANILMIQAWGLSISYLSNAWSISAEWLAYLVFPLLCLILLRGSLLMLAATLAAVTALWLLAALPDLAIWRASDLFRSGELDRVSFHSIAPLVRCLSEFIIGIGMFRIAARCAPHGRAAGVAQAGCVGAILILATIRGTDFPIVLLLALLVLALARDEGFVADLLGRSVPHYLGRISYSVYLVQDFTIGLGSRIGALLARAGLPVHSGLVAGTIVVATLLLSAASFVLIEQPARRMIRRVTERRARRPR